MYSDDEDFPVFPKQDMDALVKILDRGTESEDLVNEMTSLKHENATLRAAFRINMVRFGFSHGDVDRVLAEIPFSQTGTSEVRVRPLVWVERKIWDSSIRLMTENGRYWIIDTSNGWIIMGMDDTDGVTRLNNECYEHKEDAQNAVQKIHEQRVLAEVEVSPIIITSTMVNAALESRADDDEGEFPSMFDLLDFSGSNKARTVMRKALEAALADISVKSDDKQKNGG